MAVFFYVPSIYAQSDHFKENIYQMGKLKPRDSVPKLKVGDRAPDFTLPAVHGGEVSLRDYLGKQNVVISFVPAAWTPVCSDQWPGYNLAKDIFDENGAVLLGISVDNIPTLYSWTNQMLAEDSELWFPVLSDFWPHGEVSKAFGVLRSDGMSERALFLIDKEGIIRFIDIHDVNKRPPLEELVRRLEEIRDI